MKNHRVMDLPNSFEVYNSQRVTPTFSEGTYFEYASTVIDVFWINCMTIMDQGMNGIKERWLGEGCSTSSLTVVHKYLVAS